MEANRTDVAALIWGEDAQEVWQDLATKGPVIPSGHGVMVAGGAAVDEVLHDAARFSSNPDAAYLGSDTGLIPLQVDPPDHVRYRRLLDPLFAPRRMAALEDDVAGLVNARIDGFIGTGRCDFSEELAVPIPSATFLRLLGLPLSRLAEFLRIKDDMIRPDGDTAAEQDARRRAAGEWVFAMYTEALDARADAPPDDILGHLVRLEQGGQITREDTLNICYLLLTAGLDTVTDTLECSFAFLARHPEHRRMLVDDPSLIPAAVEELLRYESPVPSVARITTADTEVAGCPVAGHTRVSVLLASLNLDPEAFPEPLTVDFGREANRHVAFGAGVHRCLGSHLARMELRVVLREWHRRIPDYHLPEGHTLLYSASLREIRHLPLEFPPGGKAA